MAVVRIGMAGLGTVGGGVYAVLKRNGTDIERRAGDRIEIDTVVCRNLEKAKKIIGNDSVCLTNDWHALVENPEIRVVVEVMGGIEPARSLILEAIAAGKHVVTANKALLAKHGNEIFQAAAAKGVMVAYEAAVAGGIPIIKALREGLAANRIQWIAGIINGTSNFILSTMREKQSSFEETLKQAQALGYAEADPTFDIEGIDAAHKLSLLSAIAFGTPIAFDAAYIEGISQLSATDIQYAEQLGYRIKLLGISKRCDRGIELRVHPTLVPSRRLIANVEGVQNAVLVKGDAVGASLYYGRGAGAEPTASAVIADLVDTTRMLDAAASHYVPALGVRSELDTKTEWLDMAQTVSGYYMRVGVLDRTGVLADITRALAKNDVPIASVIQREASADTTDVVLLTHQALEGNVREAIRQIETLECVCSKVVMIRREELE